MEKGIQIPMAQGQSTKIMSTIEWIRTSRLSIKNSLSLLGTSVATAGVDGVETPELWVVRVGGDDGELRP